MFSLVVNGVLLFPSLIGLFVLYHLFRSQTPPADKSNRINKIRLFWFVLRHEDRFVDTFPWLKEDETKNVGS